MTIINESGDTICKSHEITEDRNYIITNRNALVDGNKKNMWIDTKGRDEAGQVLWSLRYCLP
jgi:hypothetical protein